MGHKIPFKAVGTCRNCKFSSPLDESHWQKKYHTLVCLRFPPVGASRAPGDGPWSHESFVHDKTFCGEWKEER